jgi:hypothetical protein
MKLENVSFSKMQDLLYIMRRPVDDVEYPRAEEMLSLLEQAEQKVTLHLYPVNRSRKKIKRLIDMDSWSWHQIYLAIHDNKVHYLKCNGDTSQGREWHNQCIDHFLDNKELRMEVPTAIVVTSKREPIAYYFHDHYAYVDHDIGTNWDRDIAKKLWEARLPRSHINHHSNFGGKDIMFYTRKKKELVFRAVQEDIFSRDLRQRLTKQK